MNKEFNKEKHARDLLDAEGIVGNAQNLLEGLDYVCTTHKKYLELVRGAIGLLAPALSTAYDLISEAGSDFVYSHGLKYPLDGGGDAA